VLTQVSEDHGQIARYEATATGARMAVLGLSRRPICGVRDHAHLLAEALERDHVSCSLHWLSLTEQSLMVTRSRLSKWTGELALELDSGRPDAILLHYSIFAYSYRGIPLFVHPILSVLRRSQIPVITVMHELVYPWHKGNWRGGVWAATQRAALVEVMNLSSAVIVTADFRADWLSSRRWLSKRPVAVAPVFSNLPPPAAGPPSDRVMPVVGLFGYTFAHSTISLVIEAIRLLEDRGVRLMLLGAPGRSSATGSAWLRVAAARGVESSLSFSGALQAQDLSDALATCEVLLYTDPMGTASRKGTLAASLASGRPVIAVEGRRRWAELLDSGAVLTTPRTPEALAESIQALLADDISREALGACGRVFAERRMSVTQTAETVRGFLDTVVAGVR
jgi:glycosyltransferase involved in cell wall biosynthesis